MREKKSEWMELIIDGLHPSKMWARNKVVSIELKLSSLYTH